MYSALEKYLLSAPVPGFSLPALIQPSEAELIERSQTLGWNKEEGIGPLLFTLRINGLVVLFANEIPLEMKYGTQDRKTFNC